MGDDSSFSDRREKMNGGTGKSNMGYYKALKTNVFFALLTSLGQLQCLGKVSI
jgi:hypothetical protein